MKESSPIRIRYDGSALEGHSIDVNHLAPALLAIGDLCKIANKEFNNDKASVKVLVTADIEQNCFEMSLDLVMSVYEQAKTLIGQEEIKNAKELLEWIGLIGKPVGIVGLSLFGLYKMLKGGGIDNTELLNKDGKDIIRVTIKGEKVDIAPEVFDLYKKPSVLKSVKNIVKPLTEEGYDKLEFEHKDIVTEEFSKEDAGFIMNLRPLTEEDLEEPSVVTAWIRVYSPVYDLTAKLWRFSLLNSHEFMDVTETDIAKDALERGASMVNDSYKVKLEITPVITEKGKTKNHYKILEVLDFKLAKSMQQENLDLSNDGD